MQASLFIVTNMSRLFIPGHIPDCDLIVRGELSSSLRHVAEAAGAVLCGSAVDLEAVCGEIERHRVEPHLFARYYELVLALKVGRNDEARALYREIADRARHVPAFRMVPFDEPSVAAEAGRYLRWLNPKGNAAPLIAAPDPRLWPDFAANTEAAFDLIGRADAALGSELHSLTVEVVGASRHRDSPTSFGGASTFMLWGSVILNVDAHPTRLDVASGLVHESAHQLLFGLSCREPLVANALGERYASPLRSDPRPVIGIFHATFVCARMSYAFSAMLGSDIGLAEEERLSLARRLDQSRASFAEGLATLRREARLTGLGRQILDEAATALEDA